LQIDIQLHLLIGEFSKIPKCSLEKSPDGQVPILGHFFAIFDRSAATTSVDFVCKSFEATALPLETKQANVTSVRAQSNQSPKSASSGLCAASYKGTFSKRGNTAALSISGGHFVLTGNHNDFSGTGSCIQKSSSKAEFQFRFDADNRYSISGTISVGSNGSRILNGDEIKEGKIIDHLVLSH
jgi:hypothetical protein